MVGRATRRTVALEKASLAVTSMVMALQHAMKVLGAGRPADPAPAGWVPEGVWIALCTMLAMDGVRLGRRIPGAQQPGRSGSFSGSLGWLLSYGSRWFAGAVAGTAAGWAGALAARLLLHGNTPRPAPAVAMPGLVPAATELAAGMVSCLATVAGAAGLGAAVPELLACVGGLGRTITGGRHRLATASAPRRNPEVGGRRAASAVPAAAILLGSGVKAWKGRDAAWLAWVPPFLPACRGGPRAIGLSMATAVAATAIWCVLGEWSGVACRARAGRRDDGCGGPASRSPEERVGPARGATERGTVMLELRNLCKRFGGRPVLREVSLVFTRGEIIGVVGRNGAGKTTLLSLACGLVRPDSGDVLICGRDLRGERPAALGYVGVKIGEDSLFEELTVAEHLGYVMAVDARVRRVLPAAEGRRCQPRAEVLRVLAVRFGLQEVMHQRASLLSAGMRQRLGLAMAWVHGPDLLILDEPFNGLDPEAAAWLRSAIHGHSKGPPPGCVIVSSHDLREVQELCTRVVLVEGGRVVGEGRVEELVSSAGPFCVATAEAGSGPELAEGLRRSGVQAACGRTADQVLSACPLTGHVGRGQPCEACGRTALISGLVSLERRHLTLEELYLFSRSCPPGEEGRAVPGVRRAARGTGGRAATGGLL